jgi:hypothetical protein
MSSTLAPPPELPRTLAEHPTIAAHHQRRRDLAAAVKAARATLEALVTERNSLAESRIQALASGAVTLADADARIRDVEQRIADGGAALRDQEAVLKETDRIGREVVAEVRTSVRGDALALVRHTLREMAGHFDALETLGARLEKVRRLDVVPLPLVPVLLSDLIAKFRREAKTFGVSS